MYTPPQTRIKIVTKADNSQQFYPQFKGWFFWHCFQQPCWDDSYDLSFSTLEEAQKSIDEFLKDEAHSKIQSTTYVKYP